VVPAVGARSRGRRSPNPAVTARTGERLVYVTGLIVAVVAGVGALITGDELETFFLMVAAVTTGLLCFDTSLEPRLHSRLPWMLIALAPIAKTIPIVWHQLRADSGLLLERYDHAGALAPTAQPSER